MQSCSSPSYICAWGVCNSSFCFPSCTLYSLVASEIQFLFPVGRKFRLLRIKTINAITKMSASALNAQGRALT